MKTIALIASGLTALAVFPSQSHATPFSADATTIGSLNGTWDEWPAVWPTSNSGVWEQYLMTRAPDGTTFVNAGMSQATIIFRAFNGGQRALPGGGMARAWLDEFGIFSSGGLNVLRHGVGTQDYGVISLLTGTSTSPAIRGQAHWIGVSALATANSGTGVSAAATGSSGVGVRAAGGPSGAGVIGSASGANGSGVLGTGQSGAYGVRGIVNLTGVGVYASSNNGAGAADPGTALYVDGVIKGNSWMQVSSFVAASSFQTTSDRRLKKDITDFDSGLADIDKIHVVKFKYNGLGETLDGDEQVGVVAQELEQTHPHMVSTVGRRLNPSDEKLTDVKMVNQTAFTFMLINAVKDLKGQVNDLQKIVCHDHPDQPACAKKGGGRP